MSTAEIWWLPNSRVYHDRLGCPQRARQSFAGTLIDGQPTCAGKPLRLRRCHYCATKSKIDPSYRR